MKRLACFLALVLLLPASSLRAQPDLRTQSYQFFVNGVLTAGVIGFNLSYNHDPLSRSDARRMDSAFSPDVRRFSVTVTQQGLNRLQAWLNSLTSTLPGNPAAANVAFVVRQADGTILVRWEMTGVIPATITSTASGSTGEVDATVDFYYDTLNLVQAKPD